MAWPPATASCARRAARWWTARRSSSRAPRRPVATPPPHRWWPGPDGSAEAEMFLSDFSITRPIAMIVIIIALMGAGLLALGKLRVNQIPDVEQPVLVVT